MADIDEFDRKLLRELQRDGSQSQRELAERIGLSQNACWRRLQRLTERGIVKGTAARIDREQVGLGLIVFVLLRTRHHSRDWLNEFRQHVSTIPEVIDFFRIGGDYDYLLKVAARDMGHYDEVYLHLISKVELDSVTSFFAMEAIEEQRPYPL